MTTTASPPVASGSPGTGPVSTSGTDGYDGVDVAGITASNSSLRRFLHGLPGVDQVGAEARAATLSTRSIKTTAKAWAIDLAISMIDLTTLEGQDTPGKVRALCAKALRPDPSDPTTPQVAAICVYPDMVADRRGGAARRRSTSPAWRPRSRAGGPASTSSWPTPATRWRPAPTRSTWSSTAAPSSSGRYLEVFDEIVAVKRRLRRRPTSR